MSNKTLKKIFIIIGLLAAFLFVAHFAMAAEGNTLDVGIQYGEQTGLGQEDPRIIIANIIRVVMGFLGIIALGLIIYSGWLYMSANGEAEKVEKAKKLLIGAVIGMVICLASFAIASFILNRLVDATGGNQNEAGRGDVIPGGGGNYCDSNSSLAGCQASDSNCGSGQYCDPVSCRCKSSGLPGIGEACLTSVLDTSCAAGECAAGLQCGSGCVCEAASGPGEGENCDSDLATAGCQATQCSDNLACSSEKNCTCIKTPLIAWVSPTDASSTPNGAPGNFVTIGGRYFGATKGKVIFMGDPNNTADDKEAAFPDSVNSNCTSYWQDGQIIVVVPQGAANGPIKVIDSNNFWDTTDNDRGPLLKDFAINGTKRPGLCLANPNYGFLDDPFKLQGNSFNGTNKNILFGTEASNVEAKDISNWSNTAVDAKVPNVTKGSNAVYAKIDSVTSNSLIFSIQEDATKYPYIDYIDPSQGPKGQYITIYGSNFKSYKAGTSMVKFYLSADPTKLIDADIDFPEKCKNNFWHDNYIIVKVPSVDQGEYKVKVINNMELASLPVGFTVTGGNPGPGICLIEPHNGPVGQGVSAYGNNFGSSAGNAIFYNKVNGAISGWKSEEVVTSVPTGAVTGPFKVSDKDGVLSNTVPFTVGACAADTECDSTEECCGSGTYWKGICRTKGTCAQGGSGGCAYGWMFSTSPNTSIFSCSGYNTSEACLAQSMCPNSPGSCQTRNDVVLGKCSDENCNSSYSFCNGQCAFDTLINKCKLNNSSCDTTSSSLVSGYLAECVTLNSQNVWQIDSGGSSCPLGTFLDTNGKCTVGNLNKPETCSLCASGFDCVADQCVVNSSGCQNGSTCTNGECKKDNGICECCCNINNKDQDCCAGLTCKAGGCGSGPNYGLCTGCKILVNGTFDQTASDKACNCYGTPSRYCKVDSNYPDGACADKAGAGEKCYDQASGATCDSSKPPCNTGLYCNPSDCTCKSGNLGDPCSSSANSCVPDNTRCDATQNLQCGPDCTCQKKTDSVGVRCKSNYTECTSGVDSCPSSYACLDNSKSDCRCCCDPSKTSSEKNDPNYDKCKDLNEVLSCVADKSPCDSGSRGLCCGCKADSECGGIDGCGLDACCRPRPSVVEPTNPSNGSADVCRNALIRANFSEGMDVSSFSSNMTLIADYEADQCPSGTKFLADKIDNTNYFVRWARKIKISFKKLISKITGKQALAEVDPTHNYCAVDGVVSGYNDTAGNGVITYKANQALDKNRLYYAVINGDTNISDDKAEGVLSKTGIGMYVSGTTKFNNKEFVNAKIWQFTTGSDICQVSEIAIDPVSYLFQTSENNTSDDYPSSPSYDSIRDSDKVYRAAAYAANGQELFSLDDVYSWRWDWKIDNTNVVKFLNDKQIDNSNIQTLNAQNVKDGKTTATATTKITEDNASNPSTVGKTVNQKADVYVLLCENPWPPLNTSTNIWMPWRDKSGNCSTGLEGTGCSDSHFELYYCRDSGNKGTADDLPAILKDTVVRGFSSDLNILKEFYFLREDMPSVTILSVSDQKTGGKVYASWSTVTNAIKYKVYYGEERGKYDTVLEESGTSRLITGLTNGKTYYFAVTALFSTGAESAYSNEVSLAPTDATAPSNPRELSAAQDGTAADLTWKENDSGDGVVSYKILYGTSSGVYGNSAVVEIGKACSSGSCSASIEDLSNGTYYFAVKAVDATSLESGYSNEASLQIK